MRSIQRSSIQVREYRGMPVRSGVSVQGVEESHSLLSLLPRLLEAAAAVALLLLMMGGLGVFALGLAG